MEHEKKNSEIPVEEILTSVESLELNNCNIMILPPGNIETGGVLSENLIDINLGFSISQMAYNSDKIHDLTMHSDSVGFFRSGSDIKIKTDNPLPGCILEVSDAALKSWFESSDLELDQQEGFSGYIPDPVAAEIARAAIRHFATVGDSDAHFDQMTAEAFALGIGARFMASRMAVGGDINSEMNKWSKRANETRLRRAKEFVQGNLHNQSLSVAAMASAAGISSCHFSAIFKTATGESAYAYILKQRVQFAKDMIIGTREPLGVIAHKTGFANQAHLSTTIKKFFGITPGDLRNG